MRWRRSRTSRGRRPSPGLAADLLTEALCATFPRVVGEVLAAMAECRRLRNAAEEWGCRIAARTAAEIASVSQCFCGGFTLLLCDVF